MIEGLRDVTAEEDALVVNTTGSIWRGASPVRSLEEQNLIYVDVTPPA